jgi:hypothetical protein
MVSRRRERTGQNTGLILIASSMAILTASIGMGVSVGIAASTGRAQPQNLAVPAFQRLQSLVGEWQGSDDHGRTVRSEFQSSVSRTVIMEVLTPADMEPMMTLYSLDGDAIALVHYCPTNNQPRMRAIPGAGLITELTFDFVDAKNLPTLSTGHQHKLVLHFNGEDQITESWTWRENDRNTVRVFRLTRKQSQRGPAMKKGEN